MEVRQVPLSETRALRRAVLRPHQTMEELAAHEGAQAFAVGAFDHGELIAVGFVTSEGGAGAWRIRGMATAGEHRGRGAGTAVLEALVDHAAEQGATRIWCNARTRAVPLYERAGFTKASDEFDLPGIGPHVVMELLRG